MIRDCDFDARRRRMLASLVGAAAVCIFGARSARAQAADDSAAGVAARYQTLLQGLLDDPDFRAGRGQDERHQLAFALGPESLGATVDRRTPPSSTQISKRATDLIISLEVSNEAYYNKFCRRPIWPGGQSGVTIGIGYDIGYVSKELLKTDWRDLVAEEVVERLAVACGRKGDFARALLASLDDVAIAWTTALAQFRERTLPLYVGETEAALPNTERLSADSLGALVSLVYNRGPSFNVPAARDPNRRYEEMRNIKAHMAAGRFERIPGELRSMKRIWEGQANMAGLLRRRELEAALFELGLVAPESSKPAPRSDQTAEAKREQTNEASRTRGTGEQPRSDEAPKQTETREASKAPGTGEQPRSDPMPEPKQQSGEASKPPGTGAQQRSDETAKQTPETSEASKPPGIGEQPRSDQAVETRKETGEAGKVAAAKVPPHAERMPEPKRDSTDAAAAARRNAPAARSPLSSNTIEIVLRNGRIVRADVNVDPMAVLRLVNALEGQ